MNIKEIYEERFGGPCILAIAPGRINIIGEHTDYNDGFVLPAAINLNVTCALGLNNSEIINAYAYDLDESASIQPAELSLDSSPEWLRFIAGVARVILDKGYPVRGFNIVFGSNIPIGAGLSSSAAIESAVGTGLNKIFSLGLEKQELALIGQSAEHKYVGVQCGIMDQYASVFGMKDHALLLDCRSLETEFIPLDLGEYSIVLCNSGVKHSLAGSEYNTRRLECERGINEIKKNYRQIDSFRDVTEELLSKIDLVGKIRDRCLYVVQENERVLFACRELKEGRIERVGELLYQSHEGLSKMYEVSCPELDFLVDQTKSMKSVAGSRMMGGGFGGCTINLVKTDFKAEFIDSLSKSYTSTFGLDLECYQVSISDGAGIL